MSACCTVLGIFSCCLTHTITPHTSHNNTSHLTPHTITPHHTYLTTSHNSFKGLLHVLKIMQGFFFARTPILSHASPGISICQTILCHSPLSLMSLVSLVCHTVLACHGPMGTSPHARHSYTIPGTSCTIRGTSLQSWNGQ